MIALVGTACPVAAQDDRGLAPSAAWIIDYADDSCALRRMFGEGEDQAYVEFRRFQPGLNLQATVASKRMTARNPARFRYRFGEAGEWHEGGGNTLAMANGFSGVLFTPVLVHLPEYEKLRDPLERYAYLRSIDWQEVEKSSAAAAGTITLRGAFRDTLTLQLGSLEKPIAALNACIEELTSHWGIDVDAHKSLTRPAVPVNLHETARMIDYPPQMIRQSMPGVVNIRLAIDERGRVSGCHIQMPLSDPAFEETSCADIQHALEFDPALDKDGNPIASYWITRVVFELR